MPQHLKNDARHRGGQQPTSKPRHFLAGLALPTAAAIVLMFIAAGTAVATTRPAAVMQNAAAMTTQPAVVESAAARASRLKAEEDAKAAVALAQSVAQAKSVAHTQAVAHGKVVARAKAVARTKAVARAKVVARAQAVARVKAVADKLSVTRSNQRKSLAATATKSAASTTSAPSAHSWRHPLSNPVKSSGFGFRWGRMHNGEDYAVSTGTPLRSMSTGTVSFAGVQSGYGNIVQVRYWDGTISYFGHMSSISVNKGEAVKPGQTVGQSGNTGHSTGPHLHLEIHPRGGAAVDPLPWLAAHNVAS